jgi:hypothetical protein
MKKGGEIAARGRTTVFKLKSTTPLLRLNDQSINEDLKFQDSINSDRGKWKEERAKKMAEGKGGGWMRCTN